MIMCILIKRDRLTDRDRVFKRTVAVLLLRSTSSTAVSPPVQAKVHGEVCVCVCVGGGGVTGGRVSPSPQQTTQRLKEAVKRVGVEGGGRTGVLDGNGTRGRRTAGRCLSECEGLSVSSVVVFTDISFLCCRLHGYQFDFCRTS